MVEATCTCCAASAPAAMTSTCVQMRLMLCRSRQEQQFFYPRSRRQRMGFDRAVRVPSNGTFRRSVPSHFLASSAQFLHRLHANSKQILNTEALLHQRSHAIATSRAVSTMSSQSSRRTWRAPR